MIGGRRFELRALRGFVLPWMALNCKGLARFSAAFGFFGSSDLLTV